MRVGSTRVASAIAFAVSIFVLAAPTFAQTGALGGGMDELVRLYESNSPKLLEVLKHHLTSGADEVLVNIHLNPGTTPAEALPVLAAEGFRLQAISKIDGRVSRLPPAVGRAIDVVGDCVASVLAVQRP